MSSQPSSAVLYFPATTGQQQTAVSSPLEDEVLRLFDLMQSRLLRYSMSFGISPQDGEDVVQETFLALFRHLQQDRSRANLQGWLFQVTHNLALRRRLKDVAQPIALSADAAETFDPDPNPEQQMLSSERHALLNSAVNALATVDQSCLRLRAEGLRYREISKILGISLGSVSASLARSLARLERADRR